MNDYVELRFVEVDSLNVMRVTVGRRGRLSFVKWTDGTPAAFCRQGSRTDRLSILDIEEYVLSSSEFRQLQLITG